MRSRLTSDLCVDEEQVRVLGSELTTFTMEGLQPDEPLVVGVAAVADQRVGEAATLTARTNANGNANGVSGLRVVEASSQRIRISWAPYSRATGYRVVWRHDNGMSCPDWTVTAATLLLKLRTGLVFLNINKEDPCFIQVTCDLSGFHWPHRSYIIFYRVTVYRGYSTKLTVIIGYSDHRLQ